MEIQHVSEVATFAPRRSHYSLALSSLNSSMASDKSPSRPSGASQSQSLVPVLSPTGMLTPCTVVYNGGKGTPGITQQFPAFGQWPHHTHVHR